MLPSPPPLRTVRDNFSSYGSSLSNAPYGTRFHHLSLSAMNLLVAIGVQQHAVVSTILSALRFPDKVMAVPARHLRNLLVTYWAEAVLLFPEEQEFPPSQQGVSHFDPQTFLEVRFPLGV